MKSTRKNTSSIIVWTGKTLTSILVVWLLTITIQIYYNVRFLDKITVQEGVGSLLFSAIPICMAWWLARRGRPKIGVILLVVVASIGATNTLISRGGLLSPVAQGYMTLVLLIGFIVGKRLGFASAIAIGILYTVIFLAEKRGLIVSAETIELDQTYIFLLSRLSITITFTFFAAQAIENAFDMVQGRTAELTKMNERLLSAQSDNSQMQQALERSNAALQASNAELQVSEARYRTIVRALGDAYFIAVPPDVRFVDVNDVACEMLGYTREELLGMTAGEISIPWPDGFGFQALYDSLQDENTSLRIARLIRKNGKDFPVELRVSPIDLDGGKAVFTVARDVSEREDALAKIEASLQEKEVLLREVHHRVKNNLQVVSSLMRSSARKFPNDPLLKSELKDLGSRVMSMAAIHQQLYQSGDFTQIEFATYMRKLVQEIGRTHIPPSKEIAIECALQPINLSLETAVPAGLIINELVINAIKHGYPPEKKRGVIRCKLVTDRYRDRVYMTVENDGLPFDVDDVKDGHTMGMQLVDLLVRQIGGELIATIENGVSGFTFSFRVREGRVPK